MQGGGVRGEFENYDCQIEEAYEILVDFFALCITFEMDGEYIKVVNKIIKKYFYNGSEVEQKSSIVKTFLHSPKSFVHSNVDIFDVFIALFKFIDLLVFCYYNDIEIHSKTPFKYIENAINDKRGYTKNIIDFIDKFKKENNITDVNEREKRRRESITSTPPGTPPGTPLGTPLGTPSRTPLGTPL
jgi:hypothetical protein